MHDEVEAKRIRTLLFYEFPKLYERRSETASNILGNIRSLIDEGFTGIAEQAGGSMSSRCVIIAAMPLKFQRLHLDEWKENGLARRVLICKFRLRDPGAIREAIIAGKRLRLGGNSFVWPGAIGQIPLACNEDEGRILSSYLRDQPGDTTPLILLKKMLSVLRWRAKRLHLKDNSMEILKKFSLSLSAHGDELVL